jgi:hypothetical protein
MDPGYLLVTEITNKKGFQWKCTKVAYGGVIASFLLACSFLWWQHSTGASETSTSLFSTIFRTADSDFAIPEDPPILPSTYKLNISRNDYTKMFGANGPTMDHLVRNSTLFTTAASLDGQVDVDTDANAHAIYQGQLGDCYFDAALASIAHWHPDLIENMFTHIDVANGAFKTKWFIGGRHQTVSLNDKVPTNPTSGIPFFLWTGSELTLWPALLEKAFAKIWGSYKAIEGGLQVDVFHHMLGVPVDHYSSMKKWQSGSCNGVANSDALWEKVDEAVTNRWPLGIGTYHGGYHGISGGHAYSLYDASSDYHGHGRCVRVRNPWGVNKYSGSIPGQSRTVGDFWITWDEFLQNFFYVSIARVQRDYSVPKYWDVTGTDGFAIGTGSITMSTNKPFYVQAFWPPSRMTKAAHCPAIEASGVMTVSRKGDPSSIRTSTTSHNVARVDASGAGEWIVSVRFGNLPFSSLPLIAVSAYLPTSGATMNEFQSKNIFRRCNDKKSENDCSYWASKGYCQASSRFYPFMHINCCGTCSVWTTALASSTASAAQNGVVETTELLSCGTFLSRLTTQLGGSVNPDRAFPETSASIAEGGMCGDKAHGFHTSCSKFNHWQSAIAVADRLSNDLKCFDFRPSGATCGIWNTKCTRRATFFCRIKGCGVVGSVPPHYGWSKKSKACCSCNDPSEFL